MTLKRPRQGGAIKVPQAAGKSPGDYWSRSYHPPQKGFGAEPGYFG